MSEYNCSYSCKIDCSILAVIASVIIGIITAVLAITATIFVTPVFLWVLFGIAVVYLPVTLIASPVIRAISTRSCVCRALPLLLTGILGTILTGIILLGIAFSETSIIGAIITGLLLLFFSLTIASTACLVKCATDCNDD